MISEVVGAEAFCNRKQEICDLWPAVENREKLFLYLELRLGKTFLIKLILRQLLKKRFLGAYVDLWSTDSAASFATTTAKAITQSVSSTTGKMLELGQVTL